MPNRNLSSVVLLTLALAPAAQECWLAPQKFHYSPGEEIKIDFLTGENFVGGFWDSKMYNAEGVRWISSSGIKDLSKDVRPTRGNNVIRKALQEGTQMVVMETRAVFRDWEAGQFEPYLEDNGLNDIAAARRSATNVEKQVREEYTYFAKLLLQVGERTDDTYKMRAGMRLEIIPEKNPYTLRSGDHLQCRVLYEGKPSPHTLVKVWSKLNRTTFLQNMYTEDDGTIQFPISTKGGWMVTTVKMIPGKKSGVEWQSLWGSLVFGI